MVRGSHDGPTQPGTNEVKTDQGTIILRLEGKIGMDDLQGFVSIVCAAQVLPAQNKSIFQRNKVYLVQEKISLEDCGVEDPGQAAVVSDKGDHVIILIGIRCLGMDPLVTRRENPILRGEKDRQADEISTS